MLNIFYLVILLNMDFFFFFFLGYVMLFFLWLVNLNSVYYVVHNSGACLFMPFPFNNFIVCYRAFYNKVLPGKWKNNYVAADVLIQNNKTVDMGSMYSISWAFFMVIEYCYNFVY